MALSSKHKVTCKLFPDPFDERDPVGPCTCDAIPNEYGVITDIIAKDNELVCERCGANTNILVYGEACQDCYEAARERAWEVLHGGD